jgi:hypothetical protein
LILPPSFSLLFFAALFAPLLVGMVLGPMLKMFTKASIIGILAIATTMIIGAFFPDQVLSPLFQTFGVNGVGMNTLFVMIGYTPYSMMAFFAGVTMGISWTIPPS